MSRATIALLLAAVLTGCGASSDPPVPVDATLDRHAGAGRAALALERPEQAIKQYRAALARARERDDAAAIGDIAFNLALAQLDAGELEAVLSTLHEISAELARRHAAPPASLQLTGAMALFRLHRTAEADAAAARLQGSEDHDVAARAAFLRGLIADMVGNVAGLQTAQATLLVEKGPEALADRHELGARLALREGDAPHARTQAEQAVAMRRDLLDYRGVARCLALAALAAETQDPSGAADLYLRAGRVAATRGEKSNARDWLQRAMALSRDPMLSTAAHAALAALDEKRRN